MSKLPVLVLAFNRADHVAQSMKAIREYQPERLYLECDGARPHKQGEKEAVATTRQKMLEMVDWPCEVKTLFREDNLGCAKAVYGAISWFFENEEYGCIIEDDVIVSQDFFKLCEDLLPRYKDEFRIMEISAQNKSKRNDIPNTYVYSLCYHCWGWATWRRAWEKMDMDMTAIKSMSPFYLIKRLGFFQGLMMHQYFMTAYKHIETFNSWATRWFLSICSNDGLVICPGVNLSINIGMDGGAHYEKGDENPYDYMRLGSLHWPLTYNDYIHPDKKQMRSDKYNFYRVRYIGLKKMIKKKLHLR